MFPLPRVGERWAVLLPALHCNRVQRLQRHPGQWKEVTWPDSSLSTQRGHTFRAACLSLSPTSFLPFTLQQRCSWAKDWDHAGRTHWHSPLLLRAREGAAQWRRLSPLAPLRTSWEEERAATKMAALNSTDWRPCLSSMTSFSTEWLCDRQERWTGRFKRNSAFPPPWGLLSPPSWGPVGVLFGNVLDGKSKWKLYINQAQVNAWTSGNSTPTRRGPDRSKPFAKSQGPPSSRRSPILFVNTHSTRKHAIWVTVSEYMVTTLNNGLNHIKVCRGPNGIFS